jgi:hypothetical protein
MSTSMVAMRSASVFHCSRACTMAGMMAALKPGTCRGTRPDRAVSVCSPDTWVASLQGEAGTEAGQGQRVLWAVMAQEGGGRSWPQYVLAV